MNKKSNKVLKVLDDITLYSHKPYFLAEIIVHQDKNKILDKKLAIMTKKCEVL